jgi:hypothetical protein
MSRFDTPEVCPHCGVVLPPKKLNLSAEIVGVIRTRPDLSYREIAEAYHVAKITVVRYAKRAGIRRRQKVETSR